MADINSDILEIHVHGTQAVSIKKEKDFIMNENVLSSKVKASDVERSVDMFHLKLKSIPIVYTTRLDEMNTFNKIERLTSNEAAELILVESKPQYKQITKEIKQEYGFNSPITSYIELCSNVKQLNTKAKTEAYLRNEMLLKICKPLKIVLEDIKSNKIILSSKTLACKDLTYSTDEDATILDSSEDETPLSRSTQRKSGSTKYFITTVAVKDKRSQEADIYVVEAVIGLISYYRTTIDELETIRTQHNSKSTMVLEYCCWVNRERRINKLAGVSGLTRARLTLLKKPHNCLPRPCRCCCIFVHGTMPKKPSNTEFVTYSTKSVTEVSEPVRSLIQKAYKYNPKIPSLTPDMKPKTDHLKCAVIIIKYHLVIFAQTELLGENYEIGNTGEISSYTKPTVNRSIAEERELYRKNDDAIQNFRIYFSFLICCWHKRQETIVQLCDSSKLSPSALRFMRTPHLCRSDKCECCCKPAPVNKLPLENITTKKNIVNTSSIKQVMVKLSVNNPNIHEENMHTLFQDTGTNNKCYKSLPVQKLNKSVNKPKAIQKNIKSPIKKPSSLQTVEYDSIDLTTDSYLKINSNLAKQKPSVKQRKQTVKIPSKTNGEYTDPKITLALINDTFDRFKDIKLAVNENGKLSAKINTPPGQLTPEDLKSLSDVLLLASKHVTQLGITPQNFCNQINFCRALNGHSTLTKKAPTATIDSSTKDKATLINDLRTPIVTICKATYSSMLPNTQNEALICSTFQMMSSLGGVKNQHLVRAYNLHFKEEPEQIRTLTSVARLSKIDHNKQNSAMSNNEIVKVDKATNFKDRTPVVKRKKMVEDNTDRKKLRVKPPEELIFANPMPDINVQSPFSLNQSIPSALAEYKEGTIHKPTQFYVSNKNLIPIQNISYTVPGQNTCVTANFPVPARNGYPMLFKMLEQDTPFHPPSYVPINPRPQARTCSVRSLIDSHKEQKRKRRIKKAEEALLQVTHLNKIDSEKNEMDVDIESSLKTTVIQMIKRGEDPIKNAINTVTSTDAVNMEPIVIVHDDDEEEGIFGV